ncbi:ankyrin-1-like [Leptopilina heterotoma]|uniref:ankyrin-1-like n=1 Tax=Leptopilina heterotoma TaxID=63436 RepID=UPI001CA8AFC9|nr:ankyrin-1-like [Leptopilina heterotoma]
MDNLMDYNDNSNYNQLFHAVHSGDINVVRTILERVATRTICDKTLINVAAAKGHTEIVQLLIRRDGDGNTPLHIAIKENQTEIFKLLVQEYNVNVQNLKGQAPLHYAAKYNRIEFTEFLLKLNAIVNLEDVNGETPLHCALSRQDVQIAEILFKNGATLNSQDVREYHYICSATKTGNLELVKLLMANGLNRIDHRSYSPLVDAVQWDRLEILQFLINNGLKSENCIANDDLKLLYKSFLENRIDIFKYLVDEGFKTTKSLLHDAIHKRYLNMWKYLLTCSSKIDANIAESENLFHWAVRSGLVETVKNVVDKKENIDNDSSSSKLAVYIAVENGNEEILQILLKANYSFESCFEDRSPLHVAATFQDVGLVKILLSAGADVNSQTKNSLTPLHFAACAGQPKIVKFLLENGADPSASTEFNQFYYDGTPLLLALQMYSNDFSSLRTIQKLSKITEMLISRSKKDMFHLLTNAVKINTSRNEKQNIFSNHQVTSSEEEEVYPPENYATCFDFYPEIIRCIFNSLSSSDIEYYSRSILDRTISSTFSPELIHLLMEYNDFRSCSNFGIKLWENDYKCNLLLIHYANNVKKLSKSEIQHRYVALYKVHKEKSEIFLKFIIARIVWLSNAVYSEKSAFCKEYKLYYWLEECMKQIKTMKQEKVDDQLNITFYDVLNKPVDKVAKYVRNEDLLQKIESSYTKFSAYSEFLTISVEKGMRRNNLMDECKNCLHKLIVRKYNLQISNFDFGKIFQYLSTIDLRRFLAACS